MRAGKPPGYPLPMRPTLLVAGLLASCAAPNPAASHTEAALDLHSHARPDHVKVRHFELDLDLDFDQQVVRGSVTHHLTRYDPNAPLLLDTEGLAIARVTAGEAELPFQLGPADPHLGRALQIELPPGCQTVTVHYATAATAEAMQWLQPAQTNGGTKPFLFTQGQAILTRSWIPLQDSPAVRSTWAATIRAPAGLLPIMSADQRSWDGNTGRFAMTHPVPSYLVALACGDLASRAISPRCAVWAEPSMLDLAAAELADMETMVQACEALFGPYRWGRYDVLVLPPSFPFGGMENPCLTFATPTILAGDKSLVSLIAHELAHSWSGNLVTNATWRDFWLNEGFTVHLENRIMEQVYGEERAAMEIVLGMQELAAELRELPPADQVLHIDLRGRNPDDGMTGVPYQKGAAFLRRLEELFGRAEVDRFLRNWFDQHAFQSVTTATFVAFLRRELLARHPEQASALAVERWIGAPGLPDDAPTSHSAAFAAVDEALARLSGGTPPAELATQGWVTQQWLRFLAGMPAAAPLAELDAAFGFTRSGNSEILCSWLTLAVRQGYRAVDRRVELFLLSVGRRKFLKPLYEALLASPGGRDRALAIYGRARSRYHAVAVRTLDELLGYVPPPAVKSDG